MINKINRVCIRSSGIAESAAAAREINQGSDDSAKFFAIFLALTGQCEPIVKMCKICTARDREIYWSFAKRGGRLLSSVSIERSSRSVSLTESR